MSQFAIGVGTIDIVAATGVIAAITAAADVPYTAGSAGAIGVMVVGASVAVGNAWEDIIGNDSG